MSDEAKGITLICGRCGESVDIIRHASEAEDCARDHRVMWQAIKALAERPQASKDYRKVKP